MRLSDANAIGDPSNLLSDRAYIPCALMSGLEANAANVARLARFIHSLRVHFPPSLTDTCRLGPVSRKVERTDFDGSIAVREMTLCFGPKRQLQYFQE